MVLLPRLHLALQALLSQSVTLSLSFREQRRVQNLSIWQNLFCTNCFIPRFPLRIATTMAVDECVITRLEKATMIATIHNEPEFSELFMSITSPFCSATIFFRGVAGRRNSVISGTRQACMPSLSSRK
jgi:hypothetical protein